MNKVGIIGQGFVGTAVKEGLKQYYSIETYDKTYAIKSTCSSIEAVMSKTDIIFVCVPTPMKKDGSCDISIVESVLAEMDEIAGPYDPNKTIVIKSTIPPGTTEYFNKKFKYLSIVFNPEFLTEANSIEDFKNQKRIIIGGPRPSSTIIRQLFSKAFPKAHIIKTHSTYAEMVKYTTNTFLATKVSFANEMKMMCDKLDIDYDKVVEYSTYDKRLGKSHWAVPGPDGKLGFGGSCFPKDINALICVGKDLDLRLNTITGAWKTNLDVRPEQDWKKLKGRAVVDEPGDKNDE